MVPDSHKHPGTSETRLPKPRGGSHEAVARADPVFCTRSCCDDGILNPIDSNPRHRVHPCSWTPWSSSGSLVAKMLTRVYRPQSW